MEVKEAVVAMDDDESNVVNFDPTGLGHGVVAVRPGIGGRSDLSPTDMLAKIIEESSLTDAVAVVVIGLKVDERDVDLFCSSGELSDANWIIDCAKRKMLSGEFDHER